MYLFVKRLLDILISIIAITLLLPVFLFISFAILITSGLPVFYLQERVGKNWIIFKIIKFRTMINNADKIGHNISLLNDERITLIGKYLRKSKLDELPQLINVFIGDMSLVGPRPELLKFANRYQSEYSEILKIRPGISDYASLIFINESKILIDSNDPESFYIKEVLPQKLDLCMKYLHEMSLVIDIKILFNTARGILYEVKKN
ncbi:MAG TPA: sugar transferase [Ignavibacteriaceae bacterium]|nr:sugar transferase [Ignavibacteriaceae bacterium]